MTFDSVHFHTVLQQIQGPPPGDYPVRPLWVGPSNSGARLETWQGEFGPTSVERPILPHPWDHHLYIIEGVGEIKDPGSRLVKLFYPGCAVFLEPNHNYTLRNNGACPVKLFSVKMWPS